MLPPQHSLGTKIKVGQKTTTISCIYYEEGVWRYFDDESMIDTNQEIEVISWGNWEPELEIGYVVIGKNVICGISKSEKGWLYCFDIPDSGFPNEYLRWMTKEEIKEMFPDLN